MILCSKITKVKTANHEEWLKLRSKYIGGSDAAAVVGLNPYSSAYSLWAEKTGRISSFNGNLATEVGTFLENFVAEKFEEMTGKKVRKSNQSFFNSDYPFAIANIDREIIGEDAGLEIKTTSELNLKKFKNGDYPANYYAQMVHYLAVTGKKRWYLAVLVGNRELLWFTLERDEDEINALMKAEEEFWNFVKNDIPPPPDGTRPTSETIKSLYSESNQNVADLFGYKSDIEEFLRLESQIKDLEILRDEAANRIKSFMQDSESGVCNRFKVSWKTASRSNFDSKRFAKENPDIDLSIYFKETKFRTFKVAEIKEV